MKGKGGYVYIVTNWTKSVLYTGVCANLSSRAHQHKIGEGSTFTRRYKCKYLVYYEFHDSIEDAIQREKQIKKWKREWKERLINEFNPTWRDLYNDVREMQ